MADPDIDGLFETMDRLGTFKKVIITRKMGNQEIIINDLRRTALDEQYLDPYGRPDDTTALMRIREQKWEILESLNTKMEANIRARITLGKELPEGLIRPHRTEIEEWFDKNDWVNFQKARAYIEENMILLGLRTLHDQFYKKDVFITDTYVGQKMVGADQTQGPKGKRDGGFSA